MKPSFSWRFVASLIGGFLFLVSAVRYFASDDIVGAVIAGIAALMALLMPRLMKESEGNTPTSNIAKPDEDSINADKG